MVGKKRNEDAPPLPPEAQPAGSGAVPGTEQSSEEMTFGERLKASAAGEPVVSHQSDDPDREQTPEQQLADDPNTDPELADAADDPMVIYKGPERREITKDDWERAGVTGMPTVLWERRSGHKVPKSAFTEQALQVLRQDGGFEIQ